MEENVCDNPAWTMDMGWAEFFYFWRLTQLGFKRDDFQQQKIFCFIKRAGLEVKQNKRRNNITVF